MAKLIYSSIASADGYVADEDGNFDWAALDDVRRSASGVGYLHYRTRA